MSRPWPTPPADAPLIQLIGDTHAGLTGAACPAYRLDKAFADMVNGRQLPHPAVALAVGDHTQVGNAAEAALQKPRYDALPWPVLKAFGEHDNFSAQWTDQAMWDFWGVPGNVYATDIGFATVITVPHGPTTAEYNLLTQLIEASTKPVILLAHRPLKGTYAAYSDTWLGQPDNTNDVGYSTNPDPPFRAIIDTHPIVKLVVAGHLHCAPDIRWQGIAHREVNTGQRNIAQVNAMALAYTNQSRGYGNDPLRGVYLSWYDDHIEVRVRNHGAGVWVAGFDPANLSARVKTVPFA